MSERFTDAELTRWRRLLILRDGNVCPMCQRPANVWQMQAHHIRPKSIHPELALLLENGIMLCFGCHMSIVHAGNSIVDLEKLHQWRFFVPSFERYVELAANRRYNVENQHRVRRSGLGSGEVILPIEPLSVEPS